MKMSNLHTSFLTPSSHHTSSLPRRLRLHRPTILAGILALTLLAGCEFLNNPPTIDINVEDETPVTGSTQTFTAVVEDLDEDVIKVTWSATAGQFSKTTGLEVNWTAPLEIQDVTVTAIADDRRAQGTDTARIVLSVVNDAPEISTFTSSSSHVLLGNSVLLSCTAEDPDEEEITYDFFTSPFGVGTMIHASPAANSAIWIAPTDPNLARVYDLIVKAVDAQGYLTTDTLEVLVYSEYGTVWIVDSGHNQVSKFASRGDLVATSSHSFMKPVAVANNVEEFFGCYVADHDAGEIIKLDAGGQRIPTAFSVIPNVSDLAIHRATGTLWAVSVADDDPRLFVFSTFTESEIASVKGFKHPVDITINQNRGDVWIIDVGETDRVIQIEVDAFLSADPDTLSTDFASVFSGNFNNPTSLSIPYSRTGTLYLADMSDVEVERLIYNGATGNYLRSTSIPFAEGANPYQVRVTPAGLVWVLGLDGSVTYFPETNTTQRIPIFSYTFADPYVMAVDRISGNVWVGDNGTHQVVEISSADSVGAQISGLSFVDDLVVNR